MNPIVVGIDGSEHSLRAGRLAAEIAAGAEAKLVFVYSIPPMYAGVPALIIPPEAIAQMQQAGQDILTRAAKVLERSDAERVVVEGPPAPMLAQVAHDKEASLLVVGSHGMGLVRRFLVGSVADRVMHLAERPVLVVR